MYSAAMRNSSSVADMPRFSSTGMRAFPARFSGALQQREILHVARADLDAIGVALHGVERDFVHRFGDDAHAGFFANLRENLQSLHAHSLERIGRGARLIRAASKQMRARGTHGASAFKRLFTRFHRTRPGDHHQVRSTDSGSPNLHHSVVGFHLAADQFVRFRNADRFGDSREILELHRLDRSGIAGDSDGGTRGARHHVRPGAQRFHARANRGDIFFSRGGAHDNQHGEDFITRRFWNTEDTEKPLEHGNTWKHTEGVAPSEWALCFRVIPCVSVFQGFFRVLRVPKPVTVCVNTRSVCHPLLRSNTPAHPASPHLWTPRRPGGRESARYRRCRSDRGSFPWPPATPRRRRAPMLLPCRRIRRTARPAGRGCVASLPAKRRWRACSIGLLRFAPAPRSATLDICPANAPARSCASFHA